MEEVKKLGKVENVARLYFEVGGPRETILGCLRRNDAYPVRGAETDWSVYRMTIQRSE